MRLDLCPAAALHAAQGASTASCLKHSQLVTNPAAVGDHPPAVGSSLPCRLASHYALFGRAASARQPPRATSGCPQTMGGPLRVPSVSVSKPICARPHQSACGSVRLACHRLEIHESLFAIYVVRASAWMNLLAPRPVICTGGASSTIPTFQVPESPSAGPRSPIFVTSPSPWQMGPANSSQMERWHKTMDPMASELHLRDQWARPC
jgi:hypothetical protein